MQGLFQIEWLIKNCMFLLNNALQSIYWGYLNSKQIINQLSVLRPIVLQFNLVWIQCPNYQLISRMYYDAIFLNHNNSNQQCLNWPQSLTPSIYFQQSCFSLKAIILNSIFETCMPRNVHDQWIILSKRQEKRHWINIDFLEDLAFAMLCV